MRKYKTDLIVQFAEVAGSDHQKELLSRYRRRGNDLVYTATISLREAINAEPVRVPTLDGRVLSASVDTIVNPKSVVIIANEGMPIFIGRQYDDQPRGHLFVKFVVEFPKTLRED